MQKIHTASWNLFTLTAEADRVFCQLVMCFTVFFHWMHMDAYLLFMAGLFIEFLVEKCAACQSWKSGFGWHRFRFTPSCWMRVEKSLNSWYLSGPSTASRIVSLSNYCIKCMCLFFFYISYFMRSSAGYEASLCTFTFVLRSETIGPFIRGKIRRVLHRTRLK